MISVIVPYNADRGWLNRCLASIENQTYENFECIESLSTNTVGYNFNRGLEKARGEFCKFVCEDDWLPPTALADLAEGIGNHPWICANSMNHTAKNWLDKSAVTSLEEMIEKNTINGGTTLYRTALLRAIDGMDEELETGEEYDMHLKLYSLGYIPGYIDKTVYNHQISLKQKSLILRRTRPEWRAEQINKIRARYDKRYRTV